MNTLAIRTRREVLWSSLRLDGNRVRWPVIRHEAAADGPTVVVTANVHGDESTGVAAVHALDAWLGQHLEAGVAHLYPSVNPSGLAANTRRVPEGDHDLNRCFPGRQRGTAAERLAHAVWNDLLDREPDALVDLHTDALNAIPYAIVDRPVALSGAERRALDRRLQQLASATGLTVLREYPDSLYVRFGLDRSLAGAVVNALQVPAVTIEWGPRRTVDPSAAEGMRSAVVGVLAHLGAVAASEAPHATRVVPSSGHWRRATTPRTRREGLFVPQRPPGEPFETGAVLGTVRDLAGTVLEEIRATDPGVVVSWVDGAWVEAGQVTGTLGVREGGE